MTRTFDLKSMFPNMGGEYMVFDPATRPLREVIGKAYSCRGSFLLACGLVSRSDDWVWIKGITVAAPRSIFEGTWFETDACALVCQDSICAMAASWVPKEAGGDCDADRAGSERCLLEAFEKGITCPSGILQRLYDIRRNNIMIEFKADIVVPRSLLAGTILDRDSSDGTKRTIVEPDLGLLKSCATCGSPIISHCS